MAEATAAETEAGSGAEEIRGSARIEIGAIPIDAVPGMARIAAGAYARAFIWGVGTSLRAGRRLTEAALTGEGPVELFEEVRDESVEALRRLLGIVEGADPREEAIAGSARRVTVEETRQRKRAESLRERGAQLFERAAEVDPGADPIHPGFERIVDQLAPDEARILKLLVNEGPQAIVYIHRAAPLGIGATEVARRLTLVGREAGCMRPELIPAYIDNLARLGLVAIRRDPIDDETAYQVLEAQPEVMEAMKSVNSGIFRGQSSRRSIHITDFGRSFCQVVFPPEHLTGEFPAVSAEQANAAIKPDPGIDSD